MKPTAQTILSDVPFLLSPAGFAEWASKGGWKRPKHLQYLSAALADAVFTPGSRTLVIAPPRHGKSELCSHYTPAWFLSLFPERRIILATYGDEFAMEWGRKVRNTITEHPLCGIKLAQDSKAASRWHTEQGGGMFTVGVDGDATGRGAELLIVDDTVKNAMEAQSETTQQRNWEWWKSTIRTRLQPGAAIFVIGTRWDDNDLLGKLLQAWRDGPNAEGYEPWRLIYLPAVWDGADVFSQPAQDQLGREVGEALWPEQWPVSGHDEMRRSIGEYWFTSLYQGRPTPLGGGILKERDWNYWQHEGQDLEAPIVDGRKAQLITIPRMEALIQSWDMNFLAETRDLQRGKPRSDVAGHVWGRAGQQLFLTDRAFGQWDLLQSCEAVLRLTEKHPQARLKLIEAKANGPAVMALLRQRTGGLVPVTPTASKTIRVQGIGDGSTEALRGGRAVTFAAAVQVGDVYLPHPTLFPWVREFRANLGRFPRAGKDDTDAASQAWAYLVGPAWQQIERAHHDALRSNFAPRNTHDVLRKMTREAIRSEKSKPHRRGDIYKRARF